MVKQRRRRRTIWSQLIVDHVPPTRFPHCPLVIYHHHQHQQQHHLHHHHDHHHDIYMIYICIGVYDDVRRVSLTHPILTRQQEVYWQSLQRKRESIKQGKVRVDLTKGQALNYRPEVQKLKSMSHLLKIIEEHFKSIWQSMRCFLNGH